MSKTDTNIPDFEDRFLEPEGWRWHSFTRKGRVIRFGTVSPKGRVPDAIVVCLPGLGEFGEKYFETAQTCLGMNLAFWIIDWMGQGGSGRYLKNPQKRHGSNFQNDIDDLHYFYTEYIKHSSVHPDVGRIPAAMLAHSMGANIGLRYLAQHPGIFECAAFTAPMLGLKALEKTPMPFALVLSEFLHVFTGENYVKGGRDWNPSMRLFDGDEALSSDSARVKLHTQWFEARSALQVGSVTYGWVHHALMSCAYLGRRSVLHTIETPCLFALAGREALVDNRKARRGAKMLKNCKVLEFPDAGHEILMEKDDIRGRFFEAFYALVKENIIDRPETLKPF
ncbi:MAG: alpha/beta hydrolase [Alphaproteobacteria bacterium]